MTRMKTALAATFLGVAALGLSSVAVADNSENDIKYRKAVMKSIGGHMGAMVAIVTGKVPHKGDWQAHASAIAAQADIVPHIFPEGSDFGETNAKPEIWDKPDDFKKALARFKSAADAMAKVAASGDMKAAPAALKTLGGACGGCHDAFQAKN